MTHSPGHDAESKNGLLITLEGGEGSGKSLQAEALRGRLEGCGETVVLTREPGGTPLGERLRDILLELGTGTGDPFDPLTEALLFVAARAELMARVIAPALRRDETVVCDRFMDSTTVYQGYARGVDMRAIERLNALASLGRSPDLTVLLDISPADGLVRTRAAGQDDRFGREEIAFHARVRSGYRTLAAGQPDRWLVVDAAQPPDTVTEEIWRRIEPLLRSRTSTKHPA